MPTKEVIRIEGVFMNAPHQLAEFDGTITKHFVPKDEEIVSADGFVSYALMPGEYVIVEGAPSTFDPASDWTSIECLSLKGSREVIQITPGPQGGLRVGLRRIEGQPNL